MRHRTNTTASIINNHENNLNQILGAISTFANAAAQAEANAACNNILQAMEGYEKASRNLEIARGNNDQSGINFYTACISSFRRQIDILSQNIENSSS